MRKPIRSSTIALLLFSAGGIQGCNSNQPTTMDGNTPILPQRRMICRIREAVTGDKQSSPPGIDIVHLDASTTMAAMNGDTLRVELKMSAGTGYQWRFVGFAPPTSTPNALEPLFDLTAATGETVAVETGVVGGPVYCVFEFKATAKGSSTLNFALLQLWETQVAPADARALTVTVE